jgi:ATP-dependent RNA helicase DDX35
MAEFPCEPMLARMLLAAGEYGCAEDILSIAAMLQVQGAFHGKIENVTKAWAVAEGDHLTMLNAYRAFSEQPSARQAAWCGKRQVNYRVMRRATTIREQVPARRPSAAPRLCRALRRLLPPPLAGGGPRLTAPGAQLRKYCVRFKVPLESAESEPRDICRCIVTGFFSNAAVRQVRRTGPRASAPALPLPEPRPRTRLLARVISDCHPSEGASKNRTEISIIHRFYLFSAVSSLG